MPGFPARPARSGMTLIELLVVIAIILTVIALTYLGTPSYSDRKMVYAADRLQAWLLGAKMQAKREGKATGVRILVDPTNTAATLMYIQEPDSYVELNTSTTPASFGTCSVGSSGNDAMGNPILNLLSFSPGQFSVSGNPDLDPVAIGDYIEFAGGGTVSLITGNPITNNATNQWTLFTNLGSPKTNSPYKIIRAPRPLPGEEDLNLPDQVVIDFTTNPVTNNPNSNVQPRTVHGQNFFEILFSPAGNVIGSGSGQGPIFLWLTDTQDPTNKNDRALIVAIQPGAGTIIVNQVAPSTTGNDPYLFTRDGRASGF